MTGSAATSQGSGHDPTQMRLQGIAGRVAMVTGARGGIGRRVVETLAALGAKTVGCDLAGDAIPGSLAVEMDVTDVDSVDSGFRRTEAELGPVELLVTCAGVFREVPLDELPTDEWHRTLDVNLTGTFLCVRRALDGMRAARGGRIITLSSGAGLDGGAEACSHYAASKGGVIAFTKGVASEYAMYGITANIVTPRAIRTPMIAGMEDALTEQIPVGRLGEPDDVAAAVAFLCSSHASFTTGEVHVLNGGWW
jgi:NAD(P)-dependent dehydrogenase (short-subunit alcohol dehydrogenase family)